MKFATILLAALASSTPFLAVPAVAAQGAGETALTADQRDGYRRALRFIEAGDWTGAGATLAALPSGPMADYLRAELYLAPSSPKVEAEQLTALVQARPDLPQAAQLARLAAIRGAADMPYLPAEQRMIFQGGSPRRERARPVEGDPVSNQLRAEAEPLIKADAAGELELLVMSREGALSPDALTEWRQKAAWTHYVVGDDGAARRMALLARGGSGDWAVAGEWVLGLASWRQKDCRAAADAFGRVAARADDADMRSAGHFWAARAHLACREPAAVEPALRRAAAYGETFYGLLAAAQLGQGVKPLPGARAIVAPSDNPNVRLASALVEIGEAERADRVIRHQARIGGARAHGDLIHIAGRLNLPATQFWLAHNAPAGASVLADARYPLPRYQPTRGWRVDPALVFAHTLQESSFRAAVVSPAGATGLMQVRPGTAGDIARARGEAFSLGQLRDPAANIEFGQTYLEQLRDKGATGGQLPKIIAAYNAGDQPVARWNGTVRHGGDPLLYIESIPYWETRGYVPTVLRNYWIYAAKQGADAPSLRELAQGKWPKLPAPPWGVSGTAASR